MRRQVAGERSGRGGELETAVYETVYVPDPNGTIVLLNTDDANRAFISKHEPTDRDLL